MTVTKLKQPEHIEEYKGHEIHVIHRPEVNDYVFKIDFGFSTTGLHTRKAGAVKEAKRLIDLRVPD